LRVANNSLVQLPKQLGNLSHLGELDISFNQIVALPRELCALTALTMLYAQSNALSTFPREMCRCTNLVHLYLSNNQLTDMPRKVGRLSALEKLLLSDNRLVSLPSSLLKLRKLMRVELHGNPQLDRTIAVDANCVARLPELLQRLHAEEAKENAQRLMYVPLPPEQSNDNDERAPLVYLNLPPEPTSDPALASSATTMAQSFARQIDYSLLDFGSDPNPTLLGKGATARVLAATFGGIDVAVKLLHCEESESESAMRALMAELSIASLFSHPHIVQVLACAVAPPNFAIVMERMQSSLYYDLHVQKRQFSARERLHVARGVAAGTGVCACARRDSSRHQVGQRSAGRRWRRQAERFRNRALDDHAVGVEHDVERRHGAVDRARGC
jgi:hypothetical protein